MPNDTRFCIKCGMTRPLKEFFSSYNLEKYPDGKLNMCKKCITLNVDNWEPESYKWILEEIDIPYIKFEWEKLMQKWAKDPTKVTSTSILGKYIAKMRLGQFKKYRWKDTEELNQNAFEGQCRALQAQGYTESEARKEIARTDRMPDRPIDLLDEDKNKRENQKISNEIEDNLTDEDIVMLKVKWGIGYRPDEWVRLEQLYSDMMNSYDIQGAGQRDTLKMICKASLRANQLIDIGDVEGFQKATKVYKELMTSAKLTAAQIKEDKTDAVDSVGELVAMCEKDGFIPRYYTDKARDKIDRVIQDMQKYTRDLVINELGLGNLIENSVKLLQREKLSIQKSLEDTDIDGNGEKKEEESLFNYSPQENTTKDEDYSDFYEQEEELRRQDEEGIYWDESEDEDDGT